ncbi:MAG: OsmC family protein [Candidatus Thorarchaeota archaeon]|nr:MAG: OsmC family protein [Candidatus Thorarchaeota archaeon]
MGEEPKLYDVTVVWDHKEGGEVQLKGGSSIKVVKPKGEESSPDLYTPEHLFVASVTVCFMNSFIYFTRRMHIDFKSFECVGSGTLEQIGKSFEITKIEIRSRLAIESKELKPKFERALYLGAKYCFVGNSMKSSIAHENEIIVE